MKDALGDRMKSQYEDRTRFFLPRRTYTIIRVDGRAFHTFTRHCDRPYDYDLMNAMADTMRRLCHDLQGAKFGYVQSDEISVLLTDFESTQTDAWFDGNLQKMVSLSASIATATFNDVWRRRRPDWRAGLAHFDARAFTIPDPVEVENYFVWRQKDAERNSLNMLAQAHFSHGDLQGKSMSDVHEMLHSKGLNWATLSEFVKRGRGAFRESTDGPWIEAAVPSFTADRPWLSARVPRQWPETLRTAEDVAAAPRPIDLIERSDPRWCARLSSRYRNGTLPPG